MKVAFGLLMAPGGPLPRRRDLAGFEDLVKMADDYCVQALGTYDSAFIGGDA